MCRYLITVTTIIDDGSKSCYTCHYSQLDFGHCLTYFYGNNFICEHLLLELQKEIYTFGRLYCL